MNPRIYHILNRLRHAARSMARGDRRSRGVLVYIGMHWGSSFEAIFRRYRLCYGFEANPDLYKDLARRYRRYPHVKLFNVAAADRDGEVEFNISSNLGLSSSIGHFSPEWDHVRSGRIRTERTVRVPSINMLRFLDEEGIEFIDDYVSDIQGMDLTVLRTLKPWIDAGRIGTIQCEVGRDDKPQIYHDLPPNNESSFNALLADRYEMIAKGWGVLEDGVFNQVPDSWFEMDCKWRLRASPASQPVVKETTGASAAARPVVATAAPAGRST